MSVKEKLGYRLSLALAPYIYKLICKLLFPSCRIETQGQENLDQFSRAGQPVIAAFWHHGLFYITALNCSLPWVGMVSASGDGEYIARILESLGFETVRGSRNKRGIGALKGLIAAVLRGRNASIVADGSQGPPLIAQAGAVLLASKTGAPIIPIGWSADRYIAFNSWDRTVLPKPFAKVVVKIEKPLMVPPGLKSEGLEEYRLKLENQLKANYAEVWGAVGIDEH